MNMNEDYISNQIAVYKNSKTLLEFQDKLKVAPINSYAHIHAGGETGADGRRTHSLIGILMPAICSGPLLEGGHAMNGTDQETALLREELSSLNRITTSPP